MYIACVDDDENSLERFVDKLKTSGYSKLKTFCSIGDFLSSDDLLKFDLVLSDYFFGKGLTVTNLLTSSKLPKNLKVIICTNYFEDSVYSEISKLRNVCFMKKGFSDLDLRIAIDNALSLKQKKSNIQLIESQFFVKSGQKLKPLNLKKITYFSVDGKYVIINAKDGSKHLIRFSLTEIEHKLPEYFIRVHASFIVNKNFIDSISLEERLVFIGNDTVPYSRSYKGSFFESIVIT